ncbi:MAG: SRPBCC domain-containing protein [Anaerolineales bacterium]
MAIKFEVSAVIPAFPEEIYKAWLDSKSHSQMTGAKAKVSAKVGGRFEAWDGYIRGKNIELIPSKKIVQSWRTSEFEESDPDSHVEIVLEPNKVSTKIILRHSHLPEHGMQYKQGWLDSYFDPMKSYFGKK